MSLFNHGTFRLHSSGESSFKIDCDALTDDDLTALACQVAARFTWGRTVPVPRGGTRFARALARFDVPCVELPTLIVDDVFTTGASMAQHRNLYTRQSDALGVVIFARTPPPEWITAIFQMWGLA